MDDKVMHVVSRGKNYKRILELLHDKDVEQMLYDVLHKRRVKYSTADNSGQHIDYKDMVKELEKDYKKQIDI